MQVDKSPQRVVAIDALRGFTMMWIIGGDQILLRLAAVYEGGVTEFLARHMRHSFVDGMTRGFVFFDLILPLFVFVTGVAIPLSLGKRLRGGASKRQLAFRSVRRGAILFALGLIYNGILSLDFEHQRYWSVLGTIGISYTLAALLYLYCDVRLMALIGLATLVAYGLILCFVGAAGYAAGDFTREGNIVGHIDRLLLPTWLYPTPLDPGGPFSSLCTTTNAIMGVIAGNILLEDRVRPWKKVAWFAGIGLTLLAIGWMLAPVLPVMKDLWTSTYALVAGGWSFVLLALFFLLFDIYSFRSAAYFFAVIGANAITAYLMHRIVNFDQISQFFFGGLGERIFVTEEGQQLVICVGVLAVQWLVLLLMYRRRIFLSI